MTDKTTETFIALMEATFDASPPAPDLPVAPEARGPLRRPALAVAWGFLAVLVVIGGAIGISTFGSSGEGVWAGPTSQHPAVGVDAYWEWAVADATELETGVVGVTRLGPAPGFDAAEYGSIQRLLSEAEIADDWRLDRPDPEALTPIAYIGSMQEAGTQVYMYRRDTASGKELMLCLEDNHGTSCTGTGDLRIEPFGPERPVWLSMTGPGVSQPSNRIALAMLPRDASVVVVVLTDGRSFSQRPRGGVVAFEMPGTVPIAGIEPVSVASIAVLDAAGRPIPIQERLSNG